MSAGTIAQAPLARQPGTSEEQKTSPTTIRARAPLLYISPPQQRLWQGEKISLSLKDADLVEVLRSFAKLTEINLVIDPRVKGTVTAELHDVALDQALAVILKTHQLGAELDGSVLSIAPAGR